MFEGTMRFFCEGGEGKPEDFFDLLDRFRVSYLKAVEDAAQPPGAGETGLTPEAATA
jgi:hypothetical protein